MSTWWIDTDNVIRITGLKNAETDVYVNNATIKMSLFKAPFSADGAAVTDEGSGKVGIPATGHGLLATQVIRIMHTLNYDGEWTITSIEADKIVITTTYAAETLSEALIFEGVVNGTDISVDYVNGSDGDYAGKLPNTIVILDSNSYELFVTTAAGGEQVLVRIQKLAGYRGV